MKWRLTSASMKSVAKSLVFESYTEKFINKSSGLKSDQHECLRTSGQAINQWVTVHGEANEASLCTWNQCLERVYQFSERKKAYRKIKSMPCSLIPAFLVNTPAQKQTWSSLYIFECNADVVPYCSGWLLWEGWTPSSQCLQCVQKDILPCQSPSKIKYPIK